MPLSRVQPELYEQLLLNKVDRIKHSFAEFLPPEPEVHPSQPTGYRLRAEFRMWSEADRLSYVMFRCGDSRTPVVVGDFPVAAESIQRVMPELLELLNANPILSSKLFQIEFQATLAGDLLVTLVYHRKLDRTWDSAAQQLRTTLQRGAPDISIIGRSRGQKLVLGKEYVQEVLSIHHRSYRFRQYEQSFSQPNGGVNIHMIKWVCEQATGLCGDLLELYCGNGNFTLPLSRYFDNVIATETAKVAVRSAAANIVENNICNVHVVRLSAEEAARAINGERIFRRLSVLPRPLHEFNLQTLFIDPPRAGLDDLTLAMAARFPTIIYMSCNPETLAMNLRSLIATHRIEQFALFDQFPYTDHMECGVLLKRR